MKTKTPKPTVAKKSNKPAAAPAQPQPENPLSPEVVARMKSADFLPGQMIVATQDILQLIALIKIYSTEIERLRGLLPPTKA